MHRLAPGLIALAFAGLPAAAQPAQTPPAPVAVAAPPAFAQPPNPDAFEFVAIGDMPYTLPRDMRRFENLIARINARRPAFTIHVGDIISGRTVCSDANFAEVRKRFDMFDGPLVYTPGDNDWTDCHRTIMGGFDPLERQAAMRKLFFPQPGRTLGKTPMEVETQARAMADRFAPYVENVRFSRSGVLFATAHIVGSNDNRDPKRPGAVGEYEARKAANIAWIDDAFRLASDTQAKALVLAWQANIHITPRSDADADFSPAFAPVIEAVERGARALRKPVLVIYGDYHFFEVRPFYTMNRRMVPNVTRLQVFGEDLVHGVRVTVDPHDPAVFGLTPLIVPENDPMQELQRIKE